MTSFIEIDDNDLDNLVREKFGIKNFESRCIDEAFNGMSKRYDIDGELDANAKRITKKWEDGQGKDSDYGSVKVMLNALAFHGLIEKGKYLVTYSW